MQEEILRIVIVLENCEMITVEGKHIGDFDVENIKRSINRFGCNYIGKMNKCDSLSMSVYRDCNVEKFIEWTMGFTGDLGKPFERLNSGKDITEIHIYFADGTEECIAVPWGEDSDYENIYQKSYISDKGDLYIVIDEKKGVFDEWELSEINDETDFKWKMYECKECEDEVE